MDGRRATRPSPWPIAAGSSPRSPPSTRSEGGSVPLEDLVLRRALGGGEAGLADQRHDLLDADGVHVGGGLVDVLLEQRATPVVGAEVQRHLAGRRGLPGTTGTHGGGGV